MTAFDELNAQLGTANAAWTADQTPQSQFSEQQKRRLLGVVIDEAALSAALAVPRAQAEPLMFAPVVDWRNKGGNFISPVKDQVGCGSCVSFCTVAVVESMSAIELGRTLDLSEADLHFCSDHGATCNGWWPTNAYSAIQTRGVPDEACFPYSSAFNADIPSCHVGNNRDGRAVRITESITLSSIDERKHWLTNVGPCSAVFHVFDDFFSYRSGIYHHVTGVEQGTHCVEIIGYSDVDQCWICKNSWGAAWGDQGFFRIAYGQAGIDTDFPFWTARGIKVPTQFGDGPGVVTRKPTHRDVFGRGTDNQLWQKWWDQSSGWSDWAALGGNISSAPSVVSVAPEHVDVYVRGSDNQLWQRWWVGNGWSDWTPLGGNLASAPGVVARTPDQRDVFMRGVDNQLWQKSWNRASGWSDWLALGGNISSAPSVVSAGPNHLDVYVRGADNQLWQKWRDGSQWSDWTMLGGQLASAPGVVARTPDHRDVFMRGSDRALWHRWWASGSGWSDWAQVDPAPIGSAPSVTSAAS
ncbi:MAG: C1 family peptidase [Leptolyngbyaceae cyanobacterium CAN_BIN12]|nr:C1 family peptidase [Leptolyngbyaceae cyanobacterium CAN_BIN12]